MRLVLNIIWLIFAGIWMAIAYVIAGILMCITIIGIPFGVQAFKRPATRSGRSAGRWCQPEATRPSR